MSKSNMHVDPYDMIPPESDVIWMNDKGCCIMSMDTLSKVASGEIPIKFNRCLDLDSKEELHRVGLDLREELHREKEQAYYKGYEDGRNSIDKDYVIVWGGSDNRL